MPFGIGFILVFFAFIVHCDILCMSICSFNLYEKRVLSFMSREVITNQFGTVMKRSTEVLSLGKLTFLVGPT